MLEISSFALKNLRKACPRYGSQSSFPRNDMLVSLNDILMHGLCCSISVRMGAKRVVVIFFLW